MTPYDEMCARVYELFADTPATHAEWSASPRPAGIALYLHRRSERCVVTNGQFVLVRARASHSAKGAPLLTPQTRLVVERARRVAPQIRRILADYEVDP